jgi:hypothetical protein
VHRILCLKVMQCALAAIQTPRHHWCRLEPNTATAPSCSRRRAEVALGPPIPEPPPPCLKLHLCAPHGCHGPASSSSFKLTQFHERDVCQVAADAAAGTSTPLAASGRRNVPPSDPQAPPWHRAMLQPIQRLP